MSPTMLSVGLFGWFEPIIDTEDINVPFLLVLNETCTIQVKTDGGTDDYNQPVNAGWVDESTDVPCRFETFSSREIIDNKKVVLEDVNLMVPAGTTITEDRRVIRDEDGEIYSVSLVEHGDELDTEHHIEATLDHVKDD